MDKIEFLILRNLLHNEEYWRKVIPFIKSEYFEDANQKIVYEEIHSFVTQYNQIPTKEILNIEIEKRNDINEQTFKEISKVISYLDSDPVEQDWLMDTTEKWCRDRAIYLALLQSIGIADGNDEKKSPDAIPSILSEALAVSFDNHVGHDYLEDYEEGMSHIIEKSPGFRSTLNSLTRSQKVVFLIKHSILLLLGLVSVSLCLCVIWLLLFYFQVKTYSISLWRWAEEKIAERIDANLLNVNIQDIADLPKQIFESKVNNVAQKTQGTLIIKEYPMASAHAGHFRSLLNELALKKSFS